MLASADTLRLTNCSAAYASLLHNNILLVHIILPLHSSHKVNWSNLRAVWSPPGIQTVTA